MTITAECHKCKKQIEVPSTRAASYVMLHKIPCRECYNQVLRCECEYDDAGYTLFQCYVCHQEEEDARCSCVQDHINPNCQECY